MKFRKKNILLVQEYGGGSFHLDRLLYARSILKDLNYEFTFSVPRIEKQIKRIVDLGDKLMLNPMLGPQEDIIRSNPEAISLGDLLWHRGYGERNLVKLMINTWHQEFSLRKIDLIIAKFAPGVMFAAREMLPVVNIGYYWDTPHIEHKLTPIFNNKAERVANEQQIVDVINNTRKLKNKIETIPQALHGDANFILTEPEFDCFVNKGFQHRCIGNPKAYELIKIAKKKKLNKKKIFVYLHSDRGRTMQIVKQLTLLNLKVDIDLNVTGLNPTFFKELPQNIKNVGRRSLKEIYENYAVCIHHAGIGLCEELAFIGVPQILLPTSADNDAVASVTERLGFGEIIKGVKKNRKQGNNLENLIRKWSNVDLQERVWLKTTHLRERERPLIDDAIRNSINKLLK